MLGLKVIAFVVPNVRASVDFYGRAFGFGLHFMHASRGYAELDSGAAVLAFLSEALVEWADLLGGLPIALNRPALPAASAHVALWTTHIDADWQRAVEAGAEVVKPLEAKAWDRYRVTSETWMGSLSSCAHRVPAQCPDHDPARPRSAQVPPNPAFVRTAASALRLLAVPSSQRPSAAAQREL